MRQIFGRLYVAFYVFQLGGLTAGSPAELQFLVVRETENKINLFQ